MLSLSRALRTALSILFFHSSTIVLAQTNVIKVDAVGIFRERAKLNYERAITQRVSLQGGIESGRYATWAVNGMNHYILDATGANLSFRFFPLKNQHAPFGPFFAVGLRRMWFLETSIYSPYENKGAVTNVGLDMGYKFRLGRFCVEPAFGARTGSINLGNERRPLFIPAPDLVYDLRDYAFFEVSLGYTFKKGIEPGSISKGEKPNLPAKSDRNFAFGLKAGVTGFGLATRGVPAGYDVSYKPDGGIHFGFFTGLRMTKKLAIHPEVFFGIKDKNLHYLEVPVTVSYPLAGNLRAEGGVEFAFNTAGTSYGDLNGFVEYYGRNIFDYGPVAGLRYSFSNSVAVGARYYHSLTKIFGIYEAGYPTSASGKERSLQLSVYWRIR